MFFREDGIEGFGHIQFEFSGIVIGILELNVVESISIRVDAFDSRDDLPAAVVRKRDGYGFRVIHRIIDMVLDFISLSSDHCFCCATRNGFSDRKSIASLTGRSVHITLIKFDHSEGTGCIRRGLSDRYRFGDITCLQF